MSYEVIRGSSDYGKITRRCKDDDGVLGMKYNIGNWVAISDNFACLETVGGYQNVPAHLDFGIPCGEPVNPHRFQSISTSFDDQPLESRDSIAYRELAVDYFADYVLGDYLSAQSIRIPDDAEILDLLGGSVPDTLEDLLPVLTDDPRIARKIHFVRGNFDPHTLSPYTRAAIYRLLKNRDNFRAYLADPAEFLSEAPDDDDFLNHRPPQGAGYELPDAEREALLLAAAQRRRMILQAYNHIELGGAQGDGNVYVLLGTDVESGLPTRESWDWAYDNLAAFAANNDGVVPSFGYYLSEAQLCYWAIAGPDVDRRALDYLAGSGSRVIDRTDGGPLNMSLDELVTYEYRPEYSDDGTDLFE